MRSKSREYLKQNKRSKDNVTNTVCFKSITSSILSVCLCLFQITRFVSSFEIEFCCKRSKSCKVVWTLEFIYSLMNRKYKVLKNMLCPYYVITKRRFGAMVGKWYFFPSLGKYACSILHVWVHLFSMLFSFFLFFYIIRTAFELGSKDIYSEKSELFDLFRLLL